MLEGDKDDQADQTDDVSDADANLNQEGDEGKERVDGQLPDDQGADQEGSDHGAPTPPETLQENWQYHPDAISAFDLARDEGASETQGNKDKEYRKLEAKQAEGERAAAKMALAGGIVEKVSDLVVDIGTKLSEITDEATARQQLDRILKPYGGWAALFAEDVSRQDVAKGTGDGYKLAARAMTEGGSLPKGVAEELIEFEDELADKLRIGKTAGLTPVTAFSMLRDRRDDLLRGEATSKNEAKTQKRTDVETLRSQRGEPPLKLEGVGRKKGNAGPPLDAAVIAAMPMDEYIKRRPEIAAFLAREAQLQEA